MKRKQPRNVSRLSLVKPAARQLSPNELRATAGGWPRYCICGNCKYCEWASATW